MRAGGYMATYVRALGAMSTALILTACTAAGGSVKPVAAQSADSRNLPCVPQTGSRIAGNAADQSIEARCYTSDNIGGTGVPTASQALQLLDPAIRAGH